MRTFRKSLEITERLARAEPDRADLKTDLVVSLVRPASLNQSNARTHLNRALTILETLDDEGRLAPNKQPWLDAVRNEIANL